MRKITSLMLIPLMLVLLGFSNQIMAQGETCATAVAVTPGTYTADGPATGAGAANNCYTSATNADWYYYVATADGTIDISSCFGGADTRLSVYTGTCGALVCHAFTDDDCDLGTGSFYAAELTGVNVLNGTTYYIEWDDRWSSLGFDWTLTYTAAPTYPILTPDVICQTVAGSFAAGGNVTYELNLLAAETYNFSLCDVLDLCCGGSHDGDGDLTMYDATFAQQWYIDGSSGCGYDATTFGDVTYEDWSPPSDGVYYLQVDDYYNAAASFELAFIKGGVLQLGTPTTTCQTTSGSFLATEGVYHEFYLYPTETYNFSCCTLDPCPGTSTGDMDFYMYDNTGTQVFYIDGNSGCNYNATTVGSANENFTPTYEGCYYLYVTDYYGAAASFDMSYISAPAGTQWLGTVDTDWSNPLNWSSGLPAVGDDITLAAGLTYYPVIDETAACNGLTIDAGASFTVAAGGNFTVGVDLSAFGSFIMNDGTCTITGNLYNDDAINAVVDINGGTLNINGEGWFQNAVFTFARGSFQLSGGNINVAGTVFWYDVNASSLMDGPFYMTVGGTMQTESVLFADISGGTIEVTGTESAGGFLISPSGASGFAVYNLFVSGGDYVTTRDTDANPFDVINNFDITGGTVTTENVTANTTTFAIGGDCYVGVGASLTANVSTGFNVTGTMTVAADASGYGSLIDNGLVTAGNPIVQVAMAGPQWHTISAPVAGVQSGWFTGLYLQNFDEPTNTWNDIIPTNIPLTPGVGFAYYANGTQLGAFFGDFNSGAYNLATTRNNAGWNMAGNPYPSSIDWDATAGWTKTDIADALYVEDAGAWATWIAGVGTGNGSNLIAPAQGFFVECTNVAGGNLAFTDGVRTHTRTAYLKSDVTDLLKLKVEGNGYSDDMAIRFLDDATAEFDYNYDAHKMFAYDVEIPQLYSMANGYMAINSLPATEMVATGFRTSIPGEFTISTIETSEFTNVVLEDLLTGEQTDLLATSYTFTANVDDNEGRFIVHFTPLSSPENNAQDMINIYSYHNNVYVSVPENTNGNIVIYNVTGQEVANTTIDNTLNVIMLDESAYYVVKVQSENSVTTEKVFVK